MKKIFFLIFCLYPVFVFSKELYSVELKRTKAENSSTVILLHGCAGPNIWTNDWASRLNQWGYNAVIPNQFRNRGYDNICNKGNLVPVKERIEDLPAIISWINNQKWHNGKIAIIGSSHGASTSVLAANDIRLKDSVKGIVSFYPSCRIIKDDYSNPVIPSIVHLGAKDSWTQCLDGSWHKFEKFIYTDAGHAFDINVGPRNYMGHELSYDKAAAEKSQSVTKDFLNNVLK